MGAEAGRRQKGMEGAVRTEAVKLTSMEIFTYQHLPFALCASNDPVIPSNRWRGTGSVMTMLKHFLFSYDFSKSQIGELLSTILPTKPA